MPKRLKRFLKERAPLLVASAQDVRGMVRAAFWKAALRREPRHRCPICGYHGPLLAHANKHCRILRTECPRCATYERHRLQFLALAKLSRQRDFSRSSILHFAPEAALVKVLGRLFDVHHTADIEADGVDHRIDICSMPFPDGSYDVVLASHVLEHVRDDLSAMKEIRRVLRPGGMALLPVPVVSPRTVEYPEPNASEFGHVRAVGPDYFDRYRRVFARVDVWTSDDFDDVHQLFTYEDRSVYPSAASPLRAPMPGVKHPDYVPICFR